MLKSVLACCDVPFCMYAVDAGMSLVRAIVPVLFGSVYVLSAVSVVGANKPI